MSNDPTHLRELLLGDVEAFNSWRRANLGEAVDLRGADLRGANLRKAMLAGACLDEAALDDVALTGAVLSGASFVGASLRRADLRETNFSHASLVRAELMDSPLGSALVRGADLSRASVAGARAMGANFAECRLEQLDISDCDLRGATLARTCLEGAELQLPPTLDDQSDDGEQFWARLAALPLEVREGLVQFTGMVFIASGQNSALAGGLSAVVSSLGFDQASFMALMPSGEINLDIMRITPPDSHWVRRVWLVLMCGVASAAPLTQLELSVIGHFGEQLGFTDRAMARIMSEELGLDISAN